LELKKTPQNREAKLKSLQVKILHNFKQIKTLQQNLQKTLGHYWFYHLKLRCFVVIELKVGKFEAEHVGKLGLYISAINHQKKHETDAPTIGMIICKTKDNSEVQYSLENTTQPMGVSEYQLAKLLPDNLKSSLPSIEELEDELNKWTKEVGQ
jgi:hypothetical protein